MAFGEGNRGEGLTYRAAGREAVRGDRWESRLASETHRDAWRQAQGRWGEQGGGKGASRADGRLFASIGGILAAICGTVSVGWGLPLCSHGKNVQAKELECGVR